MSDVLCMYYSRTGNTKKAMLEIASELDALYEKWEALSLEAGE